MSLVNTDIYNIVGSINQLKKEYIPEDDETLAVGVFGYFGDLEAKKIQTAVMMTDELSNEVFPNRAKLDKNVITHSIMQGIKDINATPAYMTVLIGILATDLEKYMVEDKFILDKDTPIKIENNYEFHLDYDIVITKVVKNDIPVYAAVYDMEYKNRISTVDDLYLNQPYTIKIGTDYYVLVQATIRQVMINRMYTQMITSSIIDNRTFTFEFDDQLADFDVFVTENGTTKHIIPIFEGTGVDSGIDLYCYYLFVNENTVRIKFDRASYMPGLNAKVEVVIKTTLGFGGVFTYNTNSFITFNSEKYGYTNINLLIRPNTNSVGGVDKKSVEELHQILPKEILAKGCITTETDVTNYFNLINTDMHRLQLQRKTDNQIERIYYSYFVMKNRHGDIVPTNTINLQIPDRFLLPRNDDAYILPAGSYIEYDPDTFVGTVVSDINTENEYLYTTLYAISINVDPLYSAFYMTIINDNPYLSFKWINQNSEVQFISQNCHFERNMFTNRNKYVLEFESVQNINTDMGMYIVQKDEETEEWECIENNMKTFIVLYKNGIPYRYKEATISNADVDLFKYAWRFEFDTNNKYDNNNNIYIEDLKVAVDGYSLYGYLEDNMEAYIYNLAKFDTEEGRYDLDEVIPNLDGYTVTNKYKIEGGLNFFYNYSGILSSRIKAYVNSEDDSYNYHLTGVPVLGYSYLDSEEDVLDFIEQMNYKKLYIDEALYVLENSFQIDFKFYNTYGPCRTYTVDDEETTSIRRVDIKPYFELQLKNNSDIYTKGKIIDYIKNYIEDLEATEDLHIPNMMSEIREEFKSSIVYIEYKGFNTFDANYQHMFKNVVEDKTIPPEFINIRNTVDAEGNVIPDIDIEVVNY